ncbi:MAG: hypothetical protein ACJ786_13850 [Catenulispora sp.]
MDIGEGLLLLVVGNGERLFRSRIPAVVPDALAVAELLSTGGDHGSEDVASWIERSAPGRLDALAPSLAETGALRLLGENKWVALQLTDAGRVRARAVLDQLIAAAGDHKHAALEDRALAALARVAGCFETLLPDRKHRKQRAALGRLAASGDPRQALLRAGLAAIEARKPAALKLGYRDLNLDEGFTSQPAAGFTADLLRSGLPTFDSFDGNGL